jgi:predicted DNA-binding antitoxin AbrB/MazE fold protein
MKAIPAIYKNRVFKPLEAVELDDDTKVLIRIERDVVEEMTGIVRAKKDIIDEVVENEEFYEP